MIVIDTSAFSKFLIREKNWEKVISYLDPVSDPHSVDLLLIETANVIWKYAKRYNLITIQQAFGLYKQMVKLVEQKVLTIEPSVKYIDDALKLATEHDLAIYDCLFIAHALRLNAKLITGDRHQGKIAERIGLDVVYIG